MTDKPGFTAEHKTNIMSAGKCVSAVMFAAGVVDKGLISYQDKVTTHWPEFG
jgi:CubicO group peptidase (beta-lactamase class C family)